MMHGDDTMSELFDRYSGMVTEEQIARAISANASADTQPAEAAERLSRTDARAVADFIFSRNQKAAVAAADSDTERRVYYADVEDVVYRIFNMTTFRTKDNREVNLRIVVLGLEGGTVRFVARGALANYIDAQGLERGDRILIKNALIDMARGELKSLAGTTIVKMAVSDSSFVHVSEIVREMKNVDVIGRVASIYPIRYINKENGSSVAVSRITIADSGGSLDASLWGSSAMVTAAMNANDYVKLEFCNVRERYGRLEIYANDLSRVLVNNGLEHKAKRQPS